MTHNEGNERSDFTKQFYSHIASKIFGYMTHRDEATRECRLHRFLWR